MSIAAPFVLHQYFDLFCKSIRVWYISLWQNGLNQQQARNIIEFHAAMVVGITCIFVHGVHGNANFAVANALTQCAFCRNSILHSVGFEHIVAGF
jgi:hypothetical protein